MLDFDPTWDAKIDSPDGAHNLHLTYCNEIPWGEPYYRLRLDETSFGERVFTRACAWRPRSRSPAIEEWLLDPSYPWPARARLVVIDATDPAVQEVLLEVFRGHDPAALREGYPTLKPHAWLLDRVSYETVELDPELDQVVTRTHAVSLPEQWH